MGKTVRVQIPLAVFGANPWVLIVPKGLPPDRLAVVLDVMAFLLQPEQQALTFDKGYFYPGRAGVVL